MSTTYVNTILLVVIAIANIFGLEVMEEDLQTTIEVLVTIGSAIWILVERYKKGGISAFGLRK